MFKKWIVMMLGLSLFGLVVSGCGSTSSDESPSTETIETTEDTEEVVEEGEADSSQTDLSAATENLSEVLNNAKDSLEDAVNLPGDYNSYDEIYEEYAQKIRDATPGLIEEYRTEAANNDNGLEGLAEISNNKVSTLAEIDSEGTQEMASFMMKRGSGKYEEYEEWAGKLYDVYEEEAGKIMDAYMESAQ